MTEQSRRRVFSPNSEGLVRSILEARRSRSNYLAEGLFSDPAWDILLELYAAELGQQTMTKGQLCAAIDVSEAIAERWLEALGQRSLVTRTQSQSGSATQQIALSSAGSAAMQRYFAVVVKSTVPL